MSVVDPGRVSGSGLSDPEGPGWLSIVGSMMRGSSLKLDNSSGFDAGSGLFCMNSSSDWFGSTDGISSIVVRFSFDAVTTVSPCRLVWRFSWRILRSSRTNLRLQSGHGQQKISFGRWLSWCRSKCSRRVNDLPQPDSSHLCDFFRPRRDFLGLLSDTSMCAGEDVDGKEVVPADRWLSILHNRKGKRNGGGKKRERDVMEMKEMMEISTISDRQTKEGKKKKNVKLGLQRWGRRVFLPEKNLKNKIIKCIYIYIYI